MGYKDVLNLYSVAKRVAFCRYYISRMRHDLKKFDHILETRDKFFADGHELSVFEKSEIIMRIRSVIEESKKGNHTDMISMHHKLCREGYFYTPENVQQLEEYNICSHESYCLFKTHDWSKFIDSNDCSVGSRTFDISLASNSTGSRIRTL